MSDLDAASLRPNLRPVVLAVAANLLLGGALLGWPYLRGGWRAEASMAAYARFAACLFEGEVAERPGLVLPRGERARFATLMLGSEASWPDRCRVPLRAVVQDEARFLFPSVKGAENEVRARVRQLDRELAQLDRARAAGLVPERPLELLGRLQAALVEGARAAGLERDTRREAIVLRELPDLPTPSLVPLQVGVGGRWQVGLDEGIFRATALDDRRMGHVEVQGGRVAPMLARRPRIAGVMFGGRASPWLVWSMPDAQCRDGACAQRATGLAALVEDRQRLRPWAWLAAHPVGDAEDALLLEDDAVWVAALVDAEHLAARRFPMPSRPEGAGEPPLVRPELDRTFATGPVERAHWLSGDPPSLVFLGPEGAARLSMADGASVLRLASPGGTVRIASCGEGESAWIVLGSERGARVRRADGAGAGALGLRARPPDRGALRALCTEDGWLEVWARQDGALVRARCGTEACSAPEVVVSRGVDRFDVVRFRGASWAAHTAGNEASVRWTRAGEAPHSSLPAPCWTPVQGLCGEPRVVTDGHRVAIATRQAGDMRVIVSDDGVMWRGLDGLEQP